MLRPLNYVLRKTTGLEVQRSGTARKELAIPLVSFTANRLIYFYDLLCKIEHIDGDIVECGVGWGRSLYALSVLSRHFDKGRYFFGFDSFQGLPEPSQEDEPQRISIEKGRYATTKNRVIRYLLNSGVEKEFIDSRINLIEGFFSETLPHYNARRIALLHLDCNLYQSYLDALRHLYDKVAKGGIIAFDEYYASSKFNGARKAVDKFFVGKEKPLKSDIMDRYYIVKE